jgi:hypothetical protein
VTASMPQQAGPASEGRASDADWEAPYYRVRAAGFQVLFLVEPDEAIEEVALFTRTDSTCTRVWEASAVRRVRCSREATAPVHPASGALRRHGDSAKTRWLTRATTATFPEAVREIEEVVPVNAVSTWVLPSGVTVGR